MTTEASKRMKSLQMLGVAGLAVLWGAAGCATSGTTKQSERIGNANLARAEGAKGYVEFSTLAKDRPVRLYAVEGRPKPRLVGVFGLASGKKGELDVREMSAPVCETLRVAATPGQRTFMIQRDGKTFTVPVTEGKVTPVEVDYVRLDRAGAYEVFKVDLEILEPVAEPEKQASAKAEPSKEAP